MHVNFIYTYQNHETPNGFPRKKLLLSTAELKTRGNSNLFAGTY